MRLFLTLLAALAMQANAGAFNKLFVTMFENHGYKQVTGNAHWQKVIARGMLLKNYKAVSHPSQPNYIATLAADTLHCPGDSQFDTNQKQITDLLDEKGVTWRTYQEDYSPRAGGDCNTAMGMGRYKRKHNPFMSFTQITKNKTKCQDIVSSNQLAKDTAAGTTKQFMYYTPNMDNDSHDKNLDFSGQYASGWLDQHLNALDKNGTLIMLTFDEDSGSEGNHVVTVLYGSLVKAGTQDDGTAYNHHSISKTLESNFGLGSLGRGDARANSLEHALAAGVATRNEMLDEWEAQWAAEGSVE